MKEDAISMRKGMSGRRKTPWSSLDKNALTPTQRFLSDRYEALYKERHPALKETGEADLINSVVPENCPYCSDHAISKYGLTTNNVQRYRCKACGRTFTPITGTIFDSHKISISEWMEYCLNLFRYLSMTADSWNNRNSITTSRYWLEKIFLVLEGWDNDVVLSGRVWFDETFYTVRNDDIELKPDGKKPRGISKNQLCVGVACTKSRVLCLLEGKGQPTARKSFKAFKDHIAPGSTLVHDKHGAHGLLIDALNLADEAYDSNELKKLPDNKNPMNRVNEVHARLKNFLYAHNSFNRDSMQGYLNLFSFAMNPPSNHLEKVELLLNRAFFARKVLRYRSFYKTFQ